MRVTMFFVSMLLSISVSAECVNDLTNTRFQAWIDARKPAMQSTTSRPQFRSLHRCGAGQHGGWCRRADYHREEQPGGTLGPWQDGYLRDFGAAMYNYMKTDGYDDALGGHVVGKTVYYAQAFYNDYGQVIEVLAIIELNSLPDTEACGSFGRGGLGGEICVDVPDLTLAWAQGAGAVNSMRIQMQKPNGGFVNFAEPFTPGNIGPSQPTYELPTDLQGVNAPGLVRGEDCIDNIGRSTPRLPEYSTFQQLNNAVGGGSVTLGEGETVGGGWSRGGIDWPSRICYDIEGRPQFCP